MTNHDEPRTKNEKRDHAREQAKAFREQQQRTRKRRRTAWQVGIAVVVLAVIAVVVVVVVTSNHQQNVAKAKQTTSGPANMGSDGILLTGSGGTLKAVRTPAIAAKADPTPTDESTYSGKANIVEYIDFQCPYCDQFEKANLKNVEKWVGAGKATLEIHPVSILDQESNGNRYSSRADNAAACVANYDPDAFPTLMEVLYDHQPKELANGMSDDALIGYVQSTGATDPKIASCIAGEKFASWVQASTSRTNIHVFGGTVDTSKISTPTVLVNGKVYQPTSQADAATLLTDPNQFAAFVDSIVPGATD